MRYLLYMSCLVLGVIVITLICLTAFPLPWSVLINVLTGLMWSAVGIEIWERYFAEPFPAPPEFPTHTQEKINEYLDYLQATGRTHILQSLDEALIRGDISTTHYANILGILLDFDAEYQERVNADPGGPRE